MANQYTQESPKTRLLNMTIKVNECLLWNGELTDKGYGIFWYKGKHIMAHRCSYELFVSEIPKDKQIHHICKNKSCVNPEHLEAITQMEHKNKHRYEKTHCPHGHEYTYDNTYMYRNYKSCRTCHRDWRRNHR